MIRIHPVKYINMVNINRILTIKKSSFLDYKCSVLKALCRSNSDANKQDPVFETECQQEKFINIRINNQSH